MPRQGVGGVSQHALRQTPQQMATAVDGMHPTGMHSCLLLIFTACNEVAAMLYFNRHR